MDLSDVSLIDTPSTPQAMDPPPTGDVEALIAPPKEDDIVKI